MRGPKVGQLGSSSFTAATRTRAASLAEENFDNHCVMSSTCLFVCRTVSSKGLKAGARSSGAGSAFAFFGTGLGSCCALLMYSSFLSRGSSLHSPGARHPCRSFKRDQKKLFWSAETGKRSQRLAKANWKRNLFKTLFTIDRVTANMTFQPPSLLRGESGRWLMQVSLFVGLRHPRLSFYGFLDECLAIRLMRQLLFEKEAQPRHVKRLLAWHLQN